MIHLLKPISKDTSRNIVRAWACAETINLRPAIIWGRSYGLLQANESLQVRTGPEILRVNTSPEGWNLWLDVPLAEAGVEISVHAKTEIFWLMWDMALE